MHDATPVASLRNLGPVCQRDLIAVGVFTLGDIKSLGVEQTFELVMVYRVSQGQGNRVSVNYLYALWGAVHNIDWRDVPEVEKVRLKNFIAELRGQHGLR